jgi:hypothetical protein
MMMMADNATRTSTWPFSNRSTFFFPLRIIRLVMIYGLGVGVGSADEIGMTE